jgi:hypothetical protein
VVRRGSFGYYRPVRASADQTVQRLTQRLSLPVPVSSDASMCLPVDMQV